MKKYRSEILVALILVVVIFVPLGYLVYGYVELEKDVQSLQILIDEAQEETVKMKEDALKAYCNGYDIYLDGILLEPEEVKIDSLLKHNTVVFVNHDERCIELKD